mgnify:CR=1 FL=1
MALFMAVCGSEIGDAGLARVGIQVHHAAIATHFQALQRFALEHRVSRELAQHHLDALERAKRFGAADAVVRLRFVEHAQLLALLAQHAAPLMRDGGRIIAMSSLGSLRAMPHYGFVGASKAALESLVRTYAQELGPRGIRVNAVSAGVVDTDALAHFPNREQLLAEFAQRTPAGPRLTPEDVAGAVYLLCLPEANMINGATLFVDGGFAISG